MTQQMTVPVDLTETASTNRAPIGIRLSKLVKLEISVDSFLIIRENTSSDHCERFFLFRCHCHTGFISKDGGKKCQDVDECSLLQVSILFRTHS